MKRLGYTKFVAQGGDWGAVITDLMGAEAAPELLGIHTNMPGAVPNDIKGAAFTGAPAPSGLAADEQHAFDRLAFFYKHGLGYAMEMANRPQTLYGLADSPVGLAAWILDHDEASEALMARVFAGASPRALRETTSSATSPSTGSRTRRSLRLVCIGKTSLPFSSPRTSPSRLPSAFIPMRSTPLCGAG